MDISIDPSRKTASYLSSAQLTGSTHHHQRSSSSMVRQRITSSANFVHDSYNASLDFPTYIPWQTLSSDVNEKLRQGSVKISRR